MIITKLPNLTPYPEALALQEAAVASVLAGGPEQALFCEHSACFTMGTSASAAELLNVGNIPVIPTGRGGKTTYHGPGQRIVYVIKDLRQTHDLRGHIQNLQSWLIAALADLNVQAFTTDDVGVWVQERSKSQGQSPSILKVAAIGVRMRKWIAFHGVALNINPDLTAYQRIVPCGLTKPVSSLHALGVNVSMQQVDEALIRHLSCLS